MKPCKSWRQTKSSVLFSRAVEMITRHFGSVAAMTIKNLDIEKFPVLALVYRLRGTTEIFQVSVFFISGVNLTNDLQACFYKLVNTSLLQSRP